MTNKSESVINELKAIYLFILEILRGITHPFYTPLKVAYSEAADRKEARDKATRQRIINEAKGEIIDSFEGLILELTDNAIREVNESGRYNKSFASMEALHHLKIEMMMQLSKLKKQK